MSRTLVAAAALLLGTTAGGLLLAQTEHESGVVFQGGVSLARVDVQVLDRNRRPISNLRKEDFELEVNGAVAPIVSFGAEEVPLDVIVLLDVSGSMRPHVEVIARATRNALLTLGRKDRVAILVFDRRTRVSMPFQQDHDQIVAGMNRVLASETFNGGTDITRAFYDSIKYMNANVRAEARRAIVILTDDETERNRDIRGIGRALEDGGIVVSALIAENAMGWQRGRTGRGGGTIGTSWPDIIFGPGGRRGGRVPPGGPVGGGTSSAGTEQIARNSGGESFPVNSPHALETVMERLRQAYALFFNAEQNVQTINVFLSSKATSRHYGATLNFRRAEAAGDVDVDDDISWNPTQFPQAPPGTADEDADTPTKAAKRRPGVNEPASSPSTAPVVKKDGEAEEKKGGFRRLKPGEKP